MGKRFAKLFAFALIICALPLFAYAATTAEYEVTMYLVAHDGSMLNSAIIEDPEEAYKGHAFLVIENHSTFAISICEKTIQPNTRMTIGTFGNRSDHNGVWFNVEANRTLSPCYMIAATLEQDQLAQISSLISRHNDFDGTNYNSANFALDVWNEFVDFSHNFVVNSDNPFELFISLKMLYDDENAPDSVSQNRVVISGYSFNTTANTSISYLPIDSTSPNGLCTGCGSAMPTSTYSEESYTVERICECPTHNGRHDAEERYYVTNTYCAAHNTLVRSVTEIRYVCLD